MHILKKYFSQNFYYLLSAQDHDRKAITLFYASRISDSTWIHASLGFQRRVNSSRGLRQEG